MALDPDSKKWLERLCGNNVSFNEPMARHTSLRVGGPAAAYIAPEKMSCFLELIDWSAERKIPYMVIGDGTNLLVKDKGIPGLVIVLKKCLKGIFVAGRDSERVMVSAMAGAKMKTLCSYAIRHGFEGMNFALGIPGTVGGGIMMNAGTALGSLDSIIDSISVLLPSGQMQTLGRESLKFSYRELGWREEYTDISTSKPIILEGCFCLRPSDSRRLEKEAKAILKARKEWQPTEYPSAGCFFKNPRSGKPAGELIDLAGLKNKMIGDAAISAKHANFIINKGNAKAADILSLMEHVQETVFKHFNVKLEPEVKIVGV